MVLSQLATVSTGTCVPKVKCTTAGSLPPDDEVTGLPKPLARQAQRFWFGNSVAARSFGRCLGTRGIDLFSYKWSIFLATSFSFVASFCKFTNVGNSLRRRARTASRYQWKATPIAGPLMVRLELWEEK